MPSLRQRVGVMGGWMPRNRETVRSWVAKKLEQAGDPSERAPSWHAVIQEFRRLIEDNPEIWKGFHEMFTQIPAGHENDPVGGCQVSSLSAHPICYI